MEKSTMSELETIPVLNPTNEDFTGRYNGEPYTIRAGETKEYPQHLARHLAKQLSDQILAIQVLALKKKKKDPTKPDPAIAQLVAYDNPQRRIALYDVLKDENEVEKTLTAYNFDFSDFIGEISEYYEYVAKNSSETEKKDKTDEKEEKPSEPSK